MILSITLNAQARLTDFTDDTDEASGFLSVSSVKSAVTLSLPERASGGRAVS